MANQRVLCNVAATLSATFSDQNGEPAAPAGAVTVEVRRGDDSVLLAAGTATTVVGETAAVPLSVGQNDKLDQLTATWEDAAGTIVRTIVDVVGGFYFSVADVRNVDQSLRADVVKFSDEDILRIRQEVEEELERITGRAFVPRYRRNVLNGSGYGWIQLRDIDVRRVRSLSVDQRALAADTYAVSPTGRVDMSLSNGTWGAPLDNGYSDAAFGRGRANVVAEYEYGWDSPPADLKRAAIKRLRSRLLADKTSVNDKATSMTTADGTSLTLATPGTRDWHTGIPEVDDIYNSYARQDRNEFVGSVPLL